MANGQVRTHEILLTCPSTCQSATATVLSQDKFSIHKTVAKEFEVIDHDSTVDHDSTDKLRVELQRGTWSCRSMGRDRKHKPFALGDEGYDAARQQATRFFRSISTAQPAVRGAAGGGSTSEQDIAAAKAARDKMHTTKLSSWRYGEISDQRYTSALSYEGWRQD